MRKRMPFTNRVRVVSSLRAMVVMLLTLGMSGITLALLGSQAGATGASVGSLSIIAGNGRPGPATPGLATDSSLLYPGGVAVDSSGNVYIADMYNNEVEKIDSSGNLSIIAGNGTAGRPTPGTATDSALKAPSGVAVDQWGNVYIADQGNNMVEEVDTSGNLSIIAGNGTIGPPTPGLATNSSLSYPQGVAVDSSGNVYIADVGNNMVEEIDNADNLSIIAGNGTMGPPTAGIATDSALSGPTGLAVDSMGNVYICDHYNNLIEEVDTSGDLTIIAGNGRQGPPTPGYATDSSLSFPTDLTVDQWGNVYIADQVNNRIEKVDTNGNLSVIAGNGTIGPPTPGLATNSRLSYPQGVAVDSSGDVYIADLVKNYIEKVSPPTYSVTYDLNGGSGSIPTQGNGMAGSTFTVNSSGVDPTNGGNIFAGWSDGSSTYQDGDTYTVGTSNVTLTAQWIPPSISNLPSSAISPGSFTPSVSMSSSSTGSVSSSTPATCTVNAAGSVSYLSAGTCTLTTHTYSQTILGSGFRSPDGIAVDALGNFYVADSGPNQVEQITPAGAETIIGSGFRTPSGVAVDSSGNVYVADFRHNRVVKVAPDGTQSLIGSSFSNPVGVAVDASGNVFVASLSQSVTEVSPSNVQTSIGSGFRTPSGVAVDASGNVYVADSGNNRIVEVAPDGTQTTIGTGFLNPTGVAVDTSGNVYVADSGHNRVVEVASDGTETNIGAGFSQPFGVAVDTSGNIFVTDNKHNEVVEVSPTTVGAPQSFTILTGEAIAYDLNGGQGTAPTQNSELTGGAFTVNTSGVDPTKVGYTFAGWSDGTTTYQDGDSYTVGTSNVTLAAQWTPVNYTVTYDLNGGSGTAPTQGDQNTGQSFEVNTSGVDPTKDGYTFAGWSDGTTTYQDGDSYTVGTSNVTLAAQWTPVSHMVTYDLNGGSGTAPNGLSAGTGSTISVNPMFIDPTRTGYVFAGWSDGTTTYRDGATYTVGNSDVTFQAVWTTLYNVNYNLNGGTGTAPSSESATSGTTIAVNSIMIDPLKTGYTFLGWSDGTAIYQDGSSYTMGSQNVTFTAQWVVSQAPLPGGITNGDVGTPTNSLVSSSQVTVLSVGSGGLSASVSVPVGALPNGTMVSLYPVANAGAVSGELPSGQSYVTSFVVTWQAPDGSSPNATSPISMTVTDAAIKAGDKVYEIVNGTATLLATATQDGSVTISFLGDPIVAVSEVTPPSPSHGGSSTGGAPRVATASKPASSLAATGSNLIGTWWFAGVILAIGMVFVSWTRRRMQHS